MERMNVKSKSLLTVGQKRIAPVALRSAAVLKRFSKE
jgi:hypothetical protein